MAMRRLPRSAALAPVGALVLGLAGCAGPLPVEGAPCPCPASLTCDPASKRCVRAASPVAPAPDAGSAAGDEAGLPPEAVTCVDPGPALTRPLDAEEWAATVRDLLGVTVEPTGLPRPSTLPGSGEPPPNPFASELKARYVTLADAAAARAVERLRDLLPCAPDPPGENGCARQFALGFAARAYRRPLAPGELDLLLVAFKDGRQLYGGDLGYRRLIAETLSQESFYLRVERGEASGPHPRLLSLTPWEVATRLSYFLWGTMPDDSLRAEADAGGLRTKVQVRAQAERLLASRRADTVIAAFHRRWLHVEDVRFVPKGMDTPAFSADLREALVTSGQATSALGMWAQRGDQAALFRGPLVGNRAMADFYGLSAPQGTGFEELTPLGEQQRFGILTLPAVLSTLAEGADSAPVRRGLFVVRELMCGEAISPPSGVIPPAPPPSTTTTTRLRFFEHTANPTCRACHGLFDPIGFGLENYDGYGRWRTHENGIAIDASGMTDLLGQPFDGPGGLAQLLAGSRKVSSCLVRQWFRFAMGRAALDGDTCTLEQQLEPQFEAGGRRLRPLLLAIVTSDAFLTLKRPQ
jgi:hypothetical protein